MWALESLTTKQTLNSKPDLPNPNPKSPNPKPHFSKSPSTQICLRTQTPFLEKSEHPNLPPNPKPHFSKIPSTQICRRTQNPISRKFREPKTPFLENSEHPNLPPNPKPHFSKIPSTQIYLASKDNFHFAPARREPSTCQSLPKQGL